MGTRTANMSVYKPATGEEAYSAAFSAGLDNIDAHDHSGAPNKGVQIGTAGIQDNAITPDKLSQEILSEATVQTTDATATEIVSIPLDSGQTVTVGGRCSALSSGGNEACGGDFIGVFHRPPSASPIQKVGENIINWNDNFSGSSPIISLVADTGAQAISIRANGEAAKTINWHIVYNSVAEPE